jgi:hypothetical protein
MVFFVRQVADRTAGGDPITQAQLDELKRDQRAWNEWDYLGPTDDECPFEWKPTDWGVLDGRLVAVDYAATCHNGDCRWHPKPQARAYCPGFVPEVQEPSDSVFIPNREVRGSFFPRERLSVVSGVGTE